MTNLETSMALLIEIFNKYAKEEGSPDTLTKKELKTLITNELPALLQGAKNKEEVDKRLSDLDFDGDNEVDFTEFAMAVVAMTIACHDLFKK